MTLAYLRMQNEEGDGSLKIIADCSKQEGRGATSRRGGQGEEKVGNSTTGPESTMTRAGNVPHEL